MNKKKELLLKILIASTIYTAFLGFYAIVHKDNFNGDKLKVNKKVKVVKIVKKDSFSVFMDKVKQSEIKRVAERKAKIEKQRQIELKRVLLEKKKAKERAERIRLERIRVEKIKEEKRIAKRNKYVSPSRGNGNSSSNSGNYNTTFTLSFYTSLNGSVTSSGARVQNNIVANNVLREGTVIQLEGYGEKVVLDSGGGDFNSSNRLDVFVGRNSGESDSQYNSRVCNMGRVTVRGNIIK